ncbi:hypothetical protein R6Q59_031230 [Mikania micrantha]
MRSCLTYFCASIGVGKTSLVNFIVKVTITKHPPQTVGCTVDVKHFSYGNRGSSSGSVNGDKDKDFFIELWDVSGHDHYVDCHSIFYSQINGLFGSSRSFLRAEVLSLYMISLKKGTKTILTKWDAEIAAT